MEDVIIEGDRVAVAYKMTGTHQHDFLGVPSTGKRFEFRGVFLMTVVGNQITHERRVYDSTGLELRMAFEFHKELLPKASPAESFFAAAAAILPCRAIGGDFLDYLDVGDGAFVFTLGDVAGKGVAAGLLAARVQRIVAAPARQRPSALLQRLPASTACSSAGSGNRVLSRSSTLC